MLLSRFVRDKSRIKKFFSASQLSEIYSQLNHENLNVMISIGVHELVNPLITKLTFSLTS